MTVRVVVGDSAYCEWLEDGQRRQGTFLLAALTPAPDTVGPDGFPRNPGCEP